MDPLWSLPPALLVLYAEIHYQSPLGFSLLRTDFPEIIADVPWRVKPKRNIPVLCLIKDADRHPILLDHISVTVRWDRGLLKIPFPMGGQPVQKHFWHRILELPRGKVPPGPASIDVLFAGRRGGRPFLFRNHNYRRLSHAPLVTTLATDPLPNMPGWYPGDPHVHSAFTEDQAEFGAPPVVTAQLGLAMGLCWTAITDHSYDLDDLPGNPLIPDPQLHKWNRLVALISQLNRPAKEFVTLLGEEVSCGNARGRNVHLLALEAPTFIPGSGDGAERWLHNAPTLRIAEVLKRIRRDGGVAYAAHPEEFGSNLEKLLLRRSSWTLRDYSLPGLSGLQIWNGKRDHGLEKGLDRWVQLLLRGKRLFIIGGNDAHGNFNRFRQLRLPFVAMRESHEQVFGRVRTHLRCPSGLSRENLLLALRNGWAVITDGPFVNLQVLDEMGQRADIGESIEGRKFSVEIMAKSTEEFGVLESIDLYCGHVGERREEKAESLRAERDFRGRMEAKLRLGPFRMTGSSYFRVELATSMGTKSRHALTNPIWVHPLK